MAAHGQQDITITRTVRLPHLPAREPAPPDRRQLAFAAATMCLTPPARSAILQVLRMQTEISRSHRAIRGTAHGGMSQRGDGPTFRSNHNDPSPFSFQEDQSRAGVRSVDYHRRSVLPKLKRISVDETHKSSFRPLPRVAHASQAQTTKEDVCRYAKDAARFNRLMKPRSLHRIRTSGSIVETTYFRTCRARFCRRRGCNLHL